MKICTCCKEKKENSFFYINNGYFTSNCKECTLKNQREFTQTLEGNKKRKEYRNKYNKLNPNYVKKEKERKKIWNLNNKELNRKRNKKYTKKNKKAIQKRREGKRKDLHEHYIISNLKDRSLPITSELIELKRVQIQLKREIKNESTNTQRTT